MNRRDVLGGLIILDNNATYGGFREPGTNDTGTGIAASPPYAIAARPANIGAAGGGRFNLELYNCNSGLDPDGNGPERSVAATGTTGFGRIEPAPNNFLQRVAGVTSSNPTVQCIVETTTTPLPANVPAQLFNLSLVNFMAGRPRVFNNCRLPAAWLAGLAFEDHYSSMVAQLGAIPVPANPATGFAGGIVNVTWQLNYRQLTALNRAGSEPPALDNPAIWSLSDGGEAIATYNAPEGGLDGSVTVTSVVGGNPLGTTLHLCAASDVAVTPPSPDLQLATSVLRISPYADAFSGVAGSASLEYVDGLDLNTLSLYRLEAGFWLPFAGVGGTQIDEAQQLASADFNFAGSFNEASGAVIAGFARVPEPTCLWGLGVGSLALIGRARAGRRGV